MSLKYDCKWPITNKICNIYYLLFIFYLDHILILQKLLKMEAVSMSTAPRKVIQGFQANQPKRYPRLTMKDMLLAQTVGCKLIVAVLGFRTSRKSIV